MTDECVGPVFNANKFRAGILTPPITGSALLCYPGEVQGLISRVWLLVAGKDSSPDLMTSRPTLPPASGIDGRWNWGHS